MLRALEIHRTATGTKKLQAEYRSVSVVFVSLLFPFDLPVVQKIVLCFMEALDLYGGVYQQYAVDDKGQTLLAVFGLSGFSHANNADQCIKAMIHFMRAAQTLFRGEGESKLAMSVATGGTLCTSIGNDLRRDPGLLGDVTITAARLLKFSKQHRVLILDQQANESVKQTTTTVDLGMVKVKGKDVELPIYGIPWPTLGSKGGDGLPVIGYNKERESIQTRLESWCKTKDKACFVVEASSGMGKSYLANFAMAQAKALMVPYCIVQGTERNQLNPFSSMAPLLSFIFRNGLGERKSGLLQLNSSAPQSVSSTQLNRRSIYGSDVIRKHLDVAGAETELAPLLSIISPFFQVQETPRTAALDHAAKNNLVVSLCVKIVRSFLERCSAMFVFDDVQWFDSFSLSIILQIVKSCPKVTALVNKSGGSPLFLSMILEVVITRIGIDFVLDTADRLTFARASLVGKGNLEGDADYLFGSLSSAIMFQYDKLDNAFQKILKAASILGQYFVLADIIMLAELDVTEDALLQSMRDSDIYNFLLYPTEGACPPMAGETEVDIRGSMTDIGTISCSFRHIGILNAIYESLSFEERILAHRSVGLIIENLVAADTRERLLPGLEYHFSRSNETEKIVNYKEELGIALIEKFQCVEGVRILETLVQYVSETRDDDLANLTNP
ncbi:hypothetical protein HK101_009389, partial [Irineochytrium annulatum]